MHCVIGRHTARWPLRKPTPDFDMSAIIASAICILPVLIPMLLLIRQATLQEKFLQYVRTAPVPPLTQLPALKDFKKAHADSSKRIQRLSDWSVGCIFAAFFLTCTFWRALPNGTFYAALGAGAVILFLSLRNSERKTGIDRAQARRPEFRRFVIVELIAALDKKVRRELRTVGSMDKPALILNLAPLEEVPGLKNGSKRGSGSDFEHNARAFIDHHAVGLAHQRALNDGSLQSGDTVLVLFKGVTNELKAYVTAVDQYSPAPAEDPAALGRVVIGDYTFCGGKIAHFDKTYFNRISCDNFAGAASSKNDFLTHGWVATLDCAATLLAVLYWLDDDERDAIAALVELARPLAATPAPAA